MQGARDDRLVAELLLLPSVLLVGPWQLLGGALDPLPLAAFAGVAVLASLPAAVALVVAGARPRVPDLVLYAIALCVAVAGTAWAEPTDTFERDARLCAWLAFGVALLGGASLAERGRRWAAHGFAVVALLAIVPALVAAWRGGDPALLAGATGNTGTLAHVALPGAAAGLVLAVSRGALGSRVLGGAAFAAALVHAGRAPVLSVLVVLAMLVGVLALRAFAVAAALAHRRDANERRAADAISVPVLGIALVALALVAAPHAGRALERAGTAAREIAVAGDAGDLGGVGVRFAIWRASARLIADRALPGVGAGQFQAAFPPYRAPAEIEASSAGRRLGFETEVEHPHDEPLLALAELGLVGGLAWIGLLLVAAVGGGGGALLALGSRGVLGFAALAVVGVALVHAPISANAASAPLAGLAFGAVLARDEDRRPVPLRALRPWAFLAALALIAPAAVSLAEHGLALAERQRAVRDAERGLAGGDPERALEAALAARPDSPLALGLAARGALARGERERAAEFDAAVLAHRPHQIEALVRTGLIAVLDGDPQAARVAWERVRALDRGHPAASWNLARLFLEHLEPAAAIDVLDDLRASGADVTSALDLVAEAQRGGWAPPDVLARLLETAPPFDDTAPIPEAIYAEARAFAESGDPVLERRAAGLESLAHHLWAHAHRANGDRETERRSLRQAWSASRRDDTPGSPLVALELAALELALGDPARARGILATTSPTPRARRWLDAENDRALVDAGLLEPR